MCELRRILCGALALLLLSVPALGADWHWQLPPERYKLMNTFERAQYDKAAKLLETGQPMAAATEFEKFKAQFGDSPVLSYSLFMRGYSLHQAKQRTAAVKAYQEVVDYFADQADDAAAALYYQGVAHFENGDTSKAIRCMKQMVESPVYQKSPLAAGALRHLADAYWETNETELAVKYWRQTVTQYNHVNDVECAAALSNLAAYAIVNKEYVSFESLLLIDDVTKQDPVVHTHLSDMIWRRGYDMYTQPFDRKKPISEKDLAAEQKAYYEYLKTTKDWWVKAKDTYSYYYRVLYVLVDFSKDKDERNRVLDAAIAECRQDKDKTQADAHIGQYCDILRQRTLSDQARLCVAAMTDRTAAMWKEHEILCDEGKWKEALATLEPIEASANADWASRAMNERARIYKDALGEYQKAIALYERISNPPATLWLIQDAYKRWGKLDQALKTLTEIENLFPDDAPRAVWYKASYYHEAGDSKKSIANARHLLKAFPKAPECSSAHQLLKDYGDPNFGGQTDDK